MNKEEIIKYLNKPYDEYIVHLLDVYLMNDAVFYRRYLIPCVDYAKRRMAKGDFDEILFIQCVKLSLDKFLKSEYCLKEYGEYNLPRNAGLPEKYQFAKYLADYIVEEYI